MKFGTIILDTLTVHMIYPDGTTEAVEIGSGEGQHSPFLQGVVFGSTIESDNEKDFSIVSAAA